MRYHIRRGPLAGILLSLSAATLLTASVVQAQTGEPSATDPGFCLTLPASQLDPGFGRATPDLATVDAGFYVGHSAACAPAPEPEPVPATPEPLPLRLLDHS